VRRPFVVILVRSSPASMWDNPRRPVPLEARMDLNPFRPERNALLAQVVQT